MVSMGGIRLSVSWVTLVSEVRVLERPGVALGLRGHLLVADEIGVYGVRAPSDGGTGPFDHLLGQAADVFEESVEFGADGPAHGGHGRVGDLFGEGGEMAVEGAAAA